MKLLLIAPSSGRWKGAGRRAFFNGRTFRFSLLGLLRVAAETPADVRIEIVDEQIRRIPWDREVDLVGITCMTALAPRAYEIARRFRARGVPVVLGGMHATLCTEEAIRHADAVVAGDAEGIWETVIDDARSGRLRGVYRRPSPPDLCALKPVPYELLDWGSYAVRPVQATRGCPFACDFCAVSAFHRQRHRQRPVRDVIRDVAALPDRLFIFVDDNLTADRGYARELFRALAPLGKSWVSQSTLAVARDEELVRLAAAAGCKGLFVGLESFSQGNLRGVRKAHNRVDAYREAIRCLHDHGIAVEAGMVFGFDGDGPDVFRTTLDLLDELEVDLIQVSIFTPLPGTPCRTAMQSRIVDRDWADYDFHHVVFRPHGMSAKQLQAGHDWVTREFYRPRSIARRLVRHARRPRGLQSLPYVAAVNLAYYGRIRQWGLRGWDPAARGAGYLPPRPQFSEFPADLESGGRRAGRHGSRNDGALAGHARP